jgi:hypothetical protein
MDSLVETLKNLERQVEKETHFNYHAHLAIYAALFLPPLAGLALVYYFLPELYNNLIVKISFFALFGAGVVIHFMRKRNYKNKVLSARQMVQDEMSRLQATESNEETFKNNVVEAARSIFAENSLAFNNESINYSLFWKQVFVFCKIEVDLDNQ